MTEEVAEEKLSIRNSARSLRKYGSTASHVSQSRAQDHGQTTSVVKHAVQTGDTLQGLALRYGCTTEQIRRKNRLWATDSLFLREHLLVPVMHGDAGQSCTNTIVSPTTKSPLSCTASVNNDEDDDNETSIDDFLGKIDSSIEVTKSEVQKCQGNSCFLSEVDGRERRRPPVARLRQSQVNNNVVLVSNTHQVKMERQQDEMFEL